MELTNQTNNIPDNEKMAIKVSVISIIVNLILSLIKLIAGIVANSSAMVSDAVHSASDVFSTFIVIIGVKISNREPDIEHQYGHERLESIAAIILAVILAATGIGIGLEGLEIILAPNQEELKIPGLMALLAAILSIAVKEWMYWFTRSAARKVNSDALMADAWHHRSDALSSVGAFIGILGARMGFPLLDPAASVVISVLIIKVSFDIFKDAIDKMIDKSCNEETVRRMENIISNQEGVIKIDYIKTRLFGAKIYVDVEIAADSTLNLVKSHEIAERVHDAIENEFPEVKHCMVHVNPIEVSTDFIY